MKSSVTRRVTAGPATSQLTRREIVVGGLALIGVSCAGRDPRVEAGADPAVLENPTFDLARITPNDEFYVVFWYEVPVVDGATWSLTFDGLCTGARAITLADIRSLPLREKEHTLQCIGATPRNRAISNAVWRGLPLTEILDAFGIAPLPTALHLNSGGRDSYLSTLPIDDLANMWLVVDMNGEPLPAEHGFPARLLVPGRYGMKNVKWIERLTFANAPIVGTWEAQGWDGEARYRPAAFVFFPEPDAPGLVDAPLTLVGAAFCGGVEVSRVELSDDDGATWADATLDPPGVTHVWTRWRFVVEPDGRDEYKYLVRVTAADGTATDPSFVDGEDGFQGYGRVAFKLG